ncbi:hypothetical protein C491_18174 [Natronococcus amylolyticus DSM 10524]|uniref:DUF8159 domain-containing protein n=1 Tax=Natronococcus amylolyticus DSM 10524 TaxID=1227497 RepID=L9WYK0_9EURY|nr:hypothetical protein [Natronococcus amylolyticus]ELY54555.1 hypothetical protein C491_18174 [Natronococcus amylolyticus DSM 10524]
MNRRKILLGAGAALTTTIAGCGSADGEESDEPNDADEMDDTLEDDSDDADDTPTDELSEEDGEDDEDDEDENDDPVEDRIPGFEDDSFTIDSDEISLKEVTRDDETVTVRMEAHSLDQEALEDDLEDAGRAFVGAIDDVDEFTGTVSTVEWDVEHGGTSLADFYIESEWLEAYEAEELSEDELLDRIIDTGSMD